MLLMQSGEDSALSGEWDGYGSIRARRMRRRHLLAAGVVAAGMALPPAACGGSRSVARQPAAATAAAGQTGGGTPKAGGTLLGSLTTNPQTFDSGRTVAGYTMVPVGSVMSRLLRFKTGADANVAENREVESDLALSLESPDAITWTARLRTDAKFQNVAPINGHAVEADDVKATFVRGTAPDSPNRGALEMIDPNQIQTPDAHTVVFKLKYPYASFKTVVASSLYSWIFPREVLTGTYDPTKTIVGSGPFIFDSFTPDVAVTLRGNPDWFEKGRPYLDGIKWSVVPDPSQGAAQFTAGHLDQCGGHNAQGPAANARAAFQQANPKATAIRNDPGIAPAVFFQLKAPSSPWQDVRLRRAVSMAIDRDAIKKAVDDNDAEITFFVALNLGKWALTQQNIDPSIAQYYKLDPANAKRLLDASGMGDRQWKFVYVTGGYGGGYETAAQAVANMLSTAGFKITVVQADFNKDFQNSGKGIRYGNYPTDDIVAVNIAPYEEVDPFIANYFSSATPNTLSGLHDAQLDAKLQKARMMINEDERVKAYLDIQSYVADQMLAVGGFPAQYGYDYIQPWLQGYQECASYAFGTETLSKVWLTR